MKDNTAWMQSITNWLRTKIDSHGEEMATWDRHTEEYGYHVGAKEAFEDVLTMLEKGVSDA
jgi:hypothetical protein